MHRLSGVSSLQSPFFSLLLDGAMYPGRSIFHLHLFLFSCKYLLIFCCCCSSGKSSTVLVMGDSFSLARDDGCSCKPVSSWITLLNFHAICPVWGQLICSCSGCSSKDPGLVADSSSAPAALWSVKESSKKSSRFGVVFVLRPETLRAH